MADATLRDGQMETLILPTYYCANALPLQLINRLRKRSSEVLGETRFLQQYLRQIEKWTRFVGWVEVRNPTNALGFVPQPNLRENGKGIVQETGFLTSSA